MLALSQLDIDPGESYSFTVARDKFVATFVKSKSDGNIVFKRRDTASRYVVSRADFLLMRGNGKAVRFKAAEAHRPAIEPDAFDPPAVGDSKTVAARKRKYLKAVTQKYYVTCIDDLGISRSIDKIRLFIKAHAEEHRKLGLSKAPGASTLIALCREIGFSGYRPLHLFLNGAGGDRRSNLWDQFILEKKAQLIELYYSFSDPIVTEPFAIGWFRAEIAKESKRRESSHEGVLEIPPRSTILRWLRMAATPESIARKEGRTVANRQSGGVVHHLSAKRPLECVVMDHTQIDLHVVVLDEYGEVSESTLRPWLVLVVDVYSRMILAANLTWESPSLYTLMEGLKQTVKPKRFLSHLATNPSLAFACDGFGKFRRMLVDNDLANVGQSMRMTAFSVGLTVSFAAVKNPETKSIVERAFGTLNTQVWHQAHGGVRGRPGRLRSEDPREFARFTLDEAQEILWDYIVNVYHVEVHDGIEMAPARKWMEAYEFFRRPLIDDMQQIDEAFNKTVERRLTRSGIRVGNQRFHHPLITSRLISDLYYLNEKPLTGYRKNQSVSIPVRIRAVDERDPVTEIQIYNYARKTYDPLPNFDETKIGSFAQEHVGRIENNAANEEFFPSAQVDINRGKLLQKIAPHPLVAAIEREGRDSPQRLAIHSAKTPMIARKGVQRGSAARKANKAKAKNAEAQKLLRQSNKLNDPQNTEAEMFDKNEVVANLSGSPDRFQVKDKAALLARVRQKLNLDR
ncbi:hypothetical protein [Rhizobium anhuiense]|uniref:hypothetical protein n=1 Tax=Rhizobium anhuiense TaxID=1184720 RepID=UPI0020CFCE35|nr:hypothetical protein [Rhizobium anhuiense]UTS89591.1 hypothetical protein NE851_23650 [Rhizobium anhuiense bv. trifolii]